MHLLSFRWPKVWVRSMKVSCILGCCSLHDLERPVSRCDCGEDVVPCHRFSQYRWCHSQSSTTLQLTLRCVILPARQTVFGVSVSRYFMMFQDVHLGDNLPVLGWNQASCKWHETSWICVLVNYAGWSARAVLSLPAGGWDACLVQVTGILQWQTFASLWLACVNFGWNLPRSRSPHSSYHYGQACANVARSSPLFLLPMPFYLWLTHVRCCQDGEKSKSLREAQVLEVNVMPSNGVPLTASHHARDWPGIPCWEGNNMAWVGNTYYIL